MREAYSTLTLEKGSAFLTFVSLEGPFSLRIKFGLSSRELVASPTVTAAQDLLHDCIRKA